MHSKIGKAICLFMAGGFIYVMIELLWRGYSHWTMFILGGICFILIGELNEVSDMSLVQQMLLSTFMITALELIFGIILNLVLGLNIWDYSNMPFNILGQICLPFMILWFWLSLVGIFLDDRLRHILFGEDIPKYRWI